MRNRGLELSIEVIMKQTESRKLYELENFDTALVSIMHAKSLVGVVDKSNNEAEGIECEGVKSICRFGNWKWRSYTSICVPLDE